MAKSAQADFWFMPGGRHAQHVQRVIETAEPWEAGELRIADHKFERLRLNPEAVLVSRQAPLSWGIHVGHRARTPQVSPFIRLKKTWPTTSTITVVLAGTTKRPVVVSICSGYDHDPYIPPLPWQHSAKKAKGGVEGCKRYWQEHAYLLRTPRLIVPGSQQAQPPDWW